MSALLIIAAAGAIAAELFCCLRSHRTDQARLGVHPLRRLRRGGR